MESTVGLFSAASQLLRSELADRLEHPEPGPAVSLATAKQALVDERLEHVGLGLAHLLGGVVGAAAGEHRESGEQAPLVDVEQVMRPGDCRSEGLLARVGVTRHPSASRGGGQAGRAADRPRRASCAPPQARSRAEGGPIERRPPQRPHSAEGRIQGVGAHGESARPSSSSSVGTGYTCSPWRVQTLAARDDERRSLARVEAGKLVCDSGQQLLRVVENEEQALPRQRLLQSSRPLVDDTKGGGDRGRHQGRVAEGCERPPRRPSSGKASAASAAPCSANLVLPVPPEPVSVSERTSSRTTRSTTSASSRVLPMNGVGGTGRFVR